MTQTFACTYTGVPSWFSTSKTCTRCGLAASTRLDRLMAANMVGRQRQPPVDVGVPRHDRDQMQVGVVRQRAREQLRDPLRPQVLVLQIDAAAGRAAPPSCSRGRCCVRRAVRSRTRNARRDRCATPAPRAARTPADPAAARGSVPGFRSAPRSLSSIHAIGESMSSGAGSFQRSRNVGVQRTDDRALQPQLHVVPRRMVAVALRHLHRLRVAAVRLVVAARVAQVDAAGERDVRSGAPGCRITTSF